jgi:hypothetical protein
MIQRARLGRRAVRYATVASLFCLAAVSAIRVEENAVFVCGRFMIAVKFDEGRAFFWAAVVEHLDGARALYAKIAEDWNSRLWNTPRMDDEWHGFYFYGSREPLQLTPRSDSTHIYDIDEARFPARWGFATVPTWFCFVTLGALPALFILSSTIRLARNRVRKKRGRCVRCGYDLRVTPDRCPECGAIGTTAQGAAEPYRAAPRDAHQDAASR